MQDVKDLLQHSFYRFAHRLWDGVRIDQIKKGAVKYGEPFNPDSWTSDELIIHALQENVDQMHYIVGLYQRIQKLEKENQELTNELREYQDRNFD